MYSTLSLRVVWASRTPYFSLPFPHTLSVLSSLCVSRWKKQVDLFFLYRTLDHTQQVLDSGSSLCSALLASQTKRGRRRPNENVLVQGRHVSSEFGFSVCVGGAGGCKHTEDNENGKHKKNAEHQHLDIVSCFHADISI